MADWSSLLAPATENDLKRTAPRPTKSIGTKFAAAADKQLAELAKSPDKRGKRLWWFTNSTGKLVFRPRHGSQYVTVHGANAHLVHSGKESDLKTIIKGMASDARAGKLDEALNAAAAAASKRKTSTSN